MRSAVVSHDHHHPARRPRPAARRFTNQRTPAHQERDDSRRSNRSDAPKSVSGNPVTPFSYRGTMTHFAWHRIAPTGAAQLPPPVGPAAWTCPVCAGPIVHPHRPGRARVYCTNSCKQKAYRWRRRRRCELIVPDPPERARTRDKIHALRSDLDLVSQLTNETPGWPTRRVTACGAFAMAARDRPRSWTHTKFFARSTSKDARQLDTDVCATCASLQRAPLRSVTEVLAIIEPMQRRFRQERRLAA